MGFALKMRKVELRSPKEFLMDEPLSNFDAKLRGRSAEQRVARFAWRRPRP